MRTCDVEVVEDGQRIPAEIRDGVGAGGVPDLP
ncbi:hypothetical protein AfiDRAFT_0015 [Afipia sp. 1NLS2]|nr:hypothetical protein AfiDRAFT_0015 [Afipia sp. 1NLS2]